KKKFIVVDSTITSESELIDALDNTNLSVIYFTQTNTLNIINVYDSTLTEKQYAIIESQDSIDESALENNPYINYIGPFYTTNGDTIGISRLFYVKILHENDVALLDSMANAHNVTILGNNIYMPLVYTLECTNQSTGNALEMANFFYESNLYSFAQPGTVGAFDFYIIEKHKSKDLQIFPNPSENYLYIKKMGDNINIQEIVLYDTSGEKIKTYSSDRNKISLKGLPVGLYILNIYLNDKTLTYKIFHN
nr:T9SS type A sorting domain-containing protein [Candidatus Delongbacteria bacterium]